MHWQKSAWQSSAASNFCTHEYVPGTQPPHSCHKKWATHIPCSPCSPPTFGVASGGQDSTRRAEEVRQITGKTFHLLLRCYPTAGEGLVAGSTSALARRQPLTEEPGRAEGKRLSVRGAGGYDSITLRRQGGSGLRWKEADSRTGGRWCLASWEVCSGVFCRWK